MKVGVDWPAKVQPEFLGCLEIHLEARDEIDVQRVEPLDARFQLRPGPWADPAGETFRASLAVYITELDPIIRLVDDADAFSECETRDRPKKMEGFFRQITSDPNQWSYSPVRRRGCADAGEGIGDSAPFFD